MFKSALFAFAFASAVLLSACNQQDEATKFCLSAEGTLDEMCLTAVGVGVKIP